LKAIRADSSIHALVHAMHLVLLRGACFLWYAAIGLVRWALVLLLATGIVLRVGLATTRNVLQFALMAHRAASLRLRAAVHFLIVLNI